MVSVQGVIEGSAEGVWRGCIGGVSVLCAEGVCREGL